MGENMAMKYHVTSKAVDGISDPRFGLSVDVLQSVLPVAILKPNFIVGVIGAVLDLKNLIGIHI